VIVCHGVRARGPGAAPQPPCMHACMHAARDGVRWPGRRACMRCAPTDGGREAGDVSAAQLSARAPSPPRHGGRVRVRTPSRGSLRRPHAGRRSVSSLPLLATTAQPTAPHPPCFVRMPRFINFPGHIYPCISPWQQYASSRARAPGYKTAPPRP